MTERLYYSDSYLREFEARIEARHALPEGLAVELDRTAFYPTSGGQPHDRGWLEEVPVREVEERDGRILHWLEGEASDLQAGTPGLEKGRQVWGKIDWARRFDHMQQHTGQHILSQAFLKVLNGATESFHLGQGVSAIDLDREALTPEEIYAVEDLANQVIFENRPVRIHLAQDGNELPLPLRRDSAREGPLRVVEISDFDWSACGGTHCRSTGAVGPIKIRRWERVRRHARVEFYCGWRALRDYRWKNRAVYRLSRLFSVADDRVVEAAEQHLAREQEWRKRLEEAGELFLAAEAGRLLAQSREVSGIQVVRSLLDPDPPYKTPDLARRILEGGSKRLVLLGVRGPRPTLLFACTEDLPFDMRRWIQEVSPLIEGRGGGHPQLAQAGGSRPEGLERALDRALHLLPEGSP